MGMLVASTLAACSVASSEEAVGGDRASVTEVEFDKNAVLSDTALRDTAAMSTADIQAFLDETPWGHASVLADYEEDGKSAAEIMHEAAEQHGINPLELLVRVQMEQGLVYKQTASEESISIAFGCGCPHSPVCSSKYEGFANQAACAAGTLSRSMDRALTSNGTASGWKMGEEKLTQDKVEVVPSNAATAALYTYTPWVGEAGGGRKGIGGASLHHQVWVRFADAVGYGAVRNNDAPRQAPSGVLEAGAAPEGEGEGQPQDQADAAAAPEAPEADSGSPAQPDAGAPSEDGADAGPADAPADGDADKTEGEDDDDILGEGNAPPATNAPAPRSSKSRGSRSRSSGDDDLEEATEEELAGKKKTVASGCSSTGGNAGDGSLVGLAMVAASVIAGRRRARRTSERA